jgi:HEAT repeat protein
VQGKILALGRVAVDPLADFLLLTPPSACPDSRVAAVECLGAFGGERALAALTRVLDVDDHQSLDAVVSFAEERVRNAAARAPGRLGDVRAVAPLLRALERGRLVGAGQALAEMGEVLGVPGLIACLEEPRKEPAVEALLRFGKRAVPLLVAALRAPRLVEGREPPTSAERRACCAMILGRLGEPEALAALVETLDAPNPEVRAEAALAVFALAPDRPEQIAWRLAPALGDGDLERQRRAEEALASLRGRRRSRRKPASRP